MVFSLQAGWYVNKIFWKTAYLKGHIISGGSLCIMRMIISAKLSMMSELCTPFITNCSITDMLCHMNNHGMQHTGQVVP